VSAAVTDWSWVCRTGGALTPADRRAYVPTIARVFRQFTLDRARLAVGLRRRTSLGPEELYPKAPDSAFAKRAAEEARDLQRDFMLNHGYRAWIFGHALARLDGLRPDPELLHAGGLLHDVGLEKPVRDECFTRRSAEAAERVAAQSDVAKDRSNALRDGIESENRYLRDYIAGRPS